MKFKLPQPTVQPMMIVSAMHADERTDMTAKGKYWVIRRSASYGAAFNTTGQLFVVGAPYYEWQVFEHYAMHDDIAFGADGYECGEEYVWASSPGRNAAQTIAEAFAAKHGGTIVEDKGVSKGHSDPNTYDEARWG